MMTTTYIPQFNKGVSSTKASKERVSFLGFKLPFFQLSNSNKNGHETIDTAGEDYLKQVALALTTQQLVSKETTPIENVNAGSTSGPTNPATQGKGGISDEGKKIGRRKEAFRELLSEVPYSGTVLLVGGQQCTTLMELYEEGAVRSDIFFHIIDPSEHVISKSVDLLFNWKNRCRIQRTDVFRFWTSDKFDLIWSDGFFPPEDTATACRLLTRLGGFLKPSSSLVVKDPLTVATVSEAEHSIDTEQRKLRKLIADAGLDSLHMVLTADETNSLLILTSPKTEA